MNRDTAIRTTCVSAEFRLGPPNLILANLIRTNLILTPLIPDEP